MRAKQIEVIVGEIKKVNKEVFLLSFTSSYLAKESRPGNFLHIKINSTLLRRPFSVHKVCGRKVFVLFKVRGRGTNMLSKYNKGDTLDVIGPLGKGFDARPQKQSVLVAGGIGVAPLVFLAQRLKKIKTKNIVLLGERSKKDILCEKEFKQFGFKVYVATEDGSKGTKGTVVDLLKRQLSTINCQLSTNIYACGPKEMFFKMHEAVKAYPDINCQVSFEQFMGCGLGICCGCSIETKAGYKKVCKDGPVFNLGDIW
ncbi:MAG: dihydroorotate dehydrogenase electron transfer subunit [Candidatus Omnitrophota bacterium]|nr:MAG: dihydroorotate dehydrogenase electron transfer subunit [Candidatus Omnitrophota bacterium]